MAAQAHTEAPIAEEDLLRAQIYLLLARVLADAPSAETLKLVGGLEGDDSEFGRALNVLAKTARGTAPESVQDEHFLLFVGVGKSELMPYTSYYLTGFLNDRPAAELVGDMRRLGIAPSDDAVTPEDHIGALCEMMAGLIEGSFGTPADLDTQRQFFDTHIGCWAGRFFEDLEAAESAAFYMPVATIGRLFMEIESTAFRMAA